MMFESTLATGFHQEGWRNSSLPEGEQGLLKEIQDSSPLASQARDDREHSFRESQSSIGLGTQREHSTNHGWPGTLFGRELSATVLKMVHPTRAYFVS